METEIFRMFFNNNSNVIVSLSAVEGQFQNLKFKILLLNSKILIQIL